MRGKKSFYFGRNMDIYYPLNFETARIDGKSGFVFSGGKNLISCYSVTGTAVMSDGYPLYADGMNEKGLCMAGLEFPDLAHYSDTLSDKKENVSPYEFIPWILTQCATVNEAELLLEYTHIINRPFSDSLPLTPLHWMIADRERSIAVEAVKEGLKVHDCPQNVLTNAPEYPFHAVNLRQYGSLTPIQPTADADSDGFGSPFSFGFGGIGLPGDFSSASRFVKAAFVARNSSALIDSCEDGVSELIRALFSVAVPRGSVKSRDGRDNITFYTSVMNTESGEYTRIPYSIAPFLRSVTTNVKSK